MTGARVDIKRVPELVPRDIALASHYKLDQVAPIVKVEDLLDYYATDFRSPPCTLNG